MLHADRDRCRYHVAQDSNDTSRSREPCRLSSGAREISLSIQYSTDGTNNTPQIAPDQQHTTIVGMLVHHIISRYLRPPLQIINSSCLHLLSVLSAEPRSLYT